MARRDGDQRSVTMNGSFTFTNRVTGAYTVTVATQPVGQRCLVTNDTGGMHLANALGVPLIGLFGPTNPVRTGPVFSSPARILQPPGCPPTGGGNLADLTPATVATTLRELLAPPPA